MERLVIAIVPALKDITWHTPRHGRAGATGDIIDFRRGAHSGISHKPILTERVHVPTHGPGSAAALQCVPTPNVLLRPNNRGRWVRFSASATAACLATTLAIAHAHMLRPIKFRKKSGARVGRPGTTRKRLRARMLIYTAPIRARLECTNGNAYNIKLLYKGLIASHIQ